MAEKSTSPRIRAWAWFAAKWGISAGLLALVFARVDLSEAWNEVVAVQSSAAPMLALATALFFGAHLIAAQKLGHLLSGRTQFEMIRAVMIGHFFGTALPGQVAGDAAKAVTLMDGTHSRTQVLAAVVLDKHTSLVALSFLVLLAVFLAPDMRLGLSAIGGATAAFVLLIGLSVVPTLCKTVPGPDWFKAAHEAWVSYTKDAFIMSRQAILGLVFQTLSIGVFLSLDMALGLGLDYVEWALIAGVLTIALLLPISIAGLGVREVTLITLLPMMGVPVEQALAVSLLAFALQLMAALLGAALWLSRPSSKRSPGASKLGPGS